MPTWDLHCGGKANATAAMETSFLGSCWGHVGHHTYYRPDPVTIHGIAGTVFAVEVEPAETDDAPMIHIQASLDGSEWTDIAQFEYPLGLRLLILSGRHEIAFNETTEPTPARFVRIHMPRSDLDGLAGYLDASRANVTVSPAEAAPLPERASSTCERHVMEAFFPEHPCWFGGQDNIDRHAPVDDPTGLHAAYEMVDDSWWDAPSFIHTHVLGNVSGPFSAEVSAEIWRLTHHVFTCGTQRAVEGAGGFDILAQASPDGVTWTEVGRVHAQTGQAATLSGALPEASRFLRFGTEPAGNYDAGGCHHPVAFMTSSDVRLE